jgi:ribonuclease P protein component
MVLNNEQRYHFGKDQKLKSRKLLQKLFAEGKHINAHPLKAIWLPENEIQFFQAGVSVSSRHFKKAVDRNRIKRLMREVLRLQKNELEQLLTDREKQLSLFLIYTGKDLPEYKLIFDNCAVILKKLIKTVNASH